MKIDKKKKVTKEQVDKIISKIRSEGKEREKGYEEKIKESRDRSSGRLQQEKIRLINKSESFARNREAIEKSRKDLIQKRINAMQSNSPFPSYSYTQQAKKLEEISRKERKADYGAKKLIEQQKKEKNKQRFYNVMRLGTKVDTAMSVGLERGYQKLAQLSRQRVISRQILKKSNMGVNIPDYKAPSILGDENRFFKGEFDKEKRSMFFG